MTGDYRPIPAEDILMRSREGESGFGFRRSAGRLKRRSDGISP